MGAQILDSDIAIIGISCRTAGANTPSELWDVLASSKDVQRQITRFNIDGFYHAEGASRKGLTNVKHAYMLDDQCIDKFDNSFFYTTPHEAVAIDPQQRMLLEIAYETIERAGIPLDEFVGTDTAVFAGIEGCDYSTILGRDIDATPRYLATGTPICMAANRLSYFFNLSGPSLAVDTACSSTMAALHQAVRTLQHGDAGMALVCGAKLILTPDMFISSSELGFLSPSGRCHCFDAAADGYARGEGVLAVLLKPLKAAVAHRDPIRAVIKGTRLNQDGRTQGITMPSAEAQRKNMEELYKELDILPSKIQYLEAHGTGTSAGDPLELSAIQSVYGLSHLPDQSLVVGSVKSNIGHLEACSALASIVKVTECLERGQIPPQMHFHHPNPKIDFGNVIIPTKLLPWPSTGMGGRRAAINTFGAGGTNGHAVLEFYPIDAAEPTTTGERPYLFKVSASEDNSLRALSVDYAQHFEEQRPCLRDLAYTLLSRRSTLKKTIYFTASSIEEVADKLRLETHKVHTKRTTNDGQTVFLFTGQGAQWAQMGKALIDGSALFRSVLEECDQCLAELSEEHPWSIIEELAKPKDYSNIYKAEFSQPLCTVLQLGLMALLKSWDMKPDAVVGHSSGEIAAAYAAGFISLRDAVVTAYYRGFVLDSTAYSSRKGQQKGSMCAVGLSEEESQKFLEDYRDRVQIAAVNSPKSCSISGDSDAIQELETICAKRKHFCRQLRVDKAYHSHHMLPLAAHYEKALQQSGVKPQCHQMACDMFSSVTGHQLESEACTPMYWAENMTSTVRFSQALGQCMDAHPTVSTIVEIGPHAALKGPVAEILRSIGKAEVEYFHTCSRGVNDHVSLLETAGGLIAHGVNIDSAKVNAEVHATVDRSFTYTYGNVLTNLPRYHWNHSTSFWTESRVSRNVRFRQFPRHELLGSRSVDDTPNCSSWRNHLRLNEIGWLAESKAKSDLEIPSALFLMMALEAARQTLQVSSTTAASSLTLSDIRYQRPLLLQSISDSELGLETKFIARNMKSTGRFEFEIVSLKLDDPGTWIRHCTGIFGWLDTPVVDNNNKACDTNHDLWLLEKWKALGNTMPDCISQLRTNTEGCTGHFEQSLYPHSNYPIDPQTLDHILSLTLLPLVGRNLPATYRLASVASISVPIQAPTAELGHFAIEVQPGLPFGARCNLEIWQCGASISFSGLRYYATDLCTQEPALRSLFFKASSMPEILHLNDPSGHMKLSRIVELLSHKWPMSDIGIQGLDYECTQTILNAFQVYERGKRPLVRSITIEGSSAGPSSNRVRYIETLETSDRYHMLFIKATNEYQESYDRLHSGGLICSPKSNNESDKPPQPDNAFERVTSVDILKSQWSIWRKKSLPMLRDRNTVLFANSQSRDSSLEFEVLNKPERIPLTQEEVVRFCQRPQPNRFDAVVLDREENSVITEWPGQTFILWMQTLLELADSILWVTQSGSASPSQKVAGTLLRTLQSEKPSLNVLWFVVPDLGQLNDENLLQKRLYEAYASMSQGNNEIKLEIHSNGAATMRYYPDDELSSATGLISPQKVDSALKGKDYELSFAAPEKPVILSSRPETRIPGYEETKVEVRVSVIDPTDICAFVGDDKRTDEASTTCRFFAGRRLFDNQATPSNPSVVGYTTGPHKNIVHVPTRHVYDRPQDIDLTEAACKFANVAVASCIIDSITRAREDDTLRLCVDGPLKSALDCMITEAGASIINNETSLEADFVVSFDTGDGVLVNGRAIDLHKYLQSPRGRKTVEQDWLSHQRHSCAHQAFELHHYPEALDAAKAQAQPYSTAIQHVSGEEPIPHVPVYRKSHSLFNSLGHYILIGGLGGLGRFICTWMVEQGARSIVAISRSGLRSLQARETQASITALGATLQVFEADACDRNNMCSILKELRQTAPIEGVINLAMVLGDAPMESMTGEEWDHALRVKIDSSWIIHEETLEDPLEFFILFSSVASVCGNRNQGNYNVANTFLNALAEYRQSLDLPGISIALGAMTDIGVLYDLHKANMLDVLTRSGLSHLTKAHLAKIMEAAIFESSRRDRSLILTGLEMFERDVDGKLSGRKEPLFWAELPEFSHLQTYAPPTTIEDCSHSEGNSQLSLRERIRRLLHEPGNAAPSAMQRDAKGRTLLTSSFLSFLSDLVGFAKESLDPAQPLVMYGIDSLSGVSCQYWFWRELGANVSVAKVLGGATIDGIVGEALEGLRNVAMEME